MALGRLLLMVAMTTPLVVGIALGYVALQAILGVLGGAVIRAKADTAVLTSEQVVSGSFAEVEELDEPLKLAA